MKLRRLGALALLATGLLAGSVPGLTANAATNLQVYDDALASGWSNWSWNGTTSFGATSPVFSGTRSISFTVTKAWGGLYLHTGSPVTASSYTAISFAGRASQSGQAFGMILYDGTGKALSSPVPLKNLGGDLPANAWKQYTVPLSALQASGTISGLAIQDMAGKAQPTVYIDDVKLISAVAAPTATATAPATATATPVPTTVTVKAVDSTPPALSLPANLAVSATSASGATVPFSATASDAIDGPVTVTCAPASGSTFPLGTTTVTCAATDTAGNKATGSFTVVVTDKAAPSLSLPANISVSASGASGATVSYTASASDAVDGAVPASCTPASGSAFPLGLTTVNCLATDAAGNAASGSFTVTVADRSAPQLSLPANLAVSATSASGATVPFSATASDAIDGPVTVTCAPASGSTFPLGTATVTCAATDTAGNTATGSFTVTVKPMPSDCDDVPTYTELRPKNVPYNQTRGRPADPSKAVSWNPGFAAYLAKINGNCIGDTEHILEWAARKWGFGSVPSVLGGPALNYPDLAKAQAVSESWWRQTDVGDNGESVGILQARFTYWPDADFARYSTAYAADYVMAAIRSHYDGNSWLGDGTKGNLRNAVAGWQCGCKYNGGGSYATGVFNWYSKKPWKTPWQSPWFGYY